MESRKKIFRYAVGAVIAASMFAMTACGGPSGQELPTTPDQKVELETFNFSGVESMAVNSDLIVLGTVTDVTPGRKAGTPPEDVQYRDVTIKVEELPLDRRGTAPASVVVQEVGWSSGTAIENVDQPWSRIGDRGYFFLQEDVPNKYGYLGAQARVLIDAGQVKSSGSPEVQSVQRLNNTTSTDLTKEVAAAVRKIHEEDIPNPAGPAMGDDLS